MPEALITDVVLLGLFAVQHSVMARPGFKAAWTRIVPRSVERSTYVLFSSLLLVLIFWKWQPIPAAVWDISSPALRLLVLALFALGWLAPGILADARTGIHAAEFYATGVL